MKIKSLLIGMLACTALAGCSDDVIEGMDNQEQQVSKEPAYLTVSFTTGGSSSRSTADDANNKGDTHNKENEAGQEHSGHINVGSEAENAIYSALVVVHSTANKTGYAKLYTWPEKLSATSTVSGHDDHYTLADNIELTTATYDVLVVANPYESLYEQYKEDLDADNGTNTYATVDALYKNILDGSYASGEEGAVGGKGKNFAGDILSFNNGDNTTLKGIMMANKSQCQIELKSGVDNYACVEIERVASKITFRPTDNNVYTVEVPDLSSVVMHTLTINGVTYNKATLNNTTYWVKVTEGADGNADSYTYYTYENDDQQAFELHTEQPTGTPKWVYKEGEVGTNTWTVKLEEYALVNLSKQVYNVRHTINAGSTAVPFGKLTGNNFLYTPNWEAEFNGGINNVTFVNGEFENNFTTSPWFYNTLANVSEDSKSNRNTYFATLPSAYNASSDDEVEEDNKFHDEENQDNPAIGALLAYCLENTTDIEHQTHGLSTGITFVGKIYDENGDKISPLYRYNGYLFQSIAAIKTAYDINEDKDWALINEESDTDALAKVGVVKYDSNTCYYYTTEIKHFDNSLPTDLGNMEFAIMRNNIYSLSVSGVNVIGDPWVDPIPSTPDEVDKPKLEVHAEIMPWIVRYHDIEFK